MKSMVIRPRSKMETNLVGTIFKGIVIVTKISECPISFMSDCLL